MSDLQPVNSSRVSSPTDSDTIPGDFNMNDFMQIEMDRAGVLQQNLELQKDDIEKNNNQLKALQAALAAVDTQVPANAGDDTTGGNVTMSADAWAALQKTSAVSDGVIGSVNYNDDGTVTANWGPGGATKIANSLKDTISEFSNNSQMDMITLQGQLNNYNQQIELITNTYQKISESGDKIVGNIR